LGWAGNLSDASAAYDALFTDPSSSVELVTLKGSSTTGDENGSGGGHSAIDWTDGNGQNKYINQYPKNREAANNLHWVDSENQGGTKLFEMSESKISKVDVRRIDMDGINSFQPSSRYHGVFANCSSASGQALRSGGVWWAYSPWFGIMNPATLQHMMEMRNGWLAFYGL
jgi:hypothetical protein